MYFAAPSALCVAHRPTRSTATPAMTQLKRPVHTLSDAELLHELSRAAREAEQTFECRSDEGTGPLIKRLERLLTTADDVLNVYEKPNQ